MGKLESDHKEGIRREREETRRSPLPIPFMFLQLKWATMRESESVGEGGGVERDLRGSD